MPNNNDHPTSLSVAARALDKIKEFNLPATPEIYQIFYADLSGTNATLTAALRRTLEVNGTITIDDLQTFREQFFNGDVADKLSDLGDEFAHEVDRIVNTLEVAIGVTNGFEYQLAGPKSKLTAKVDKQSIISIIDALAAATQEMRAKKKKLGERLSESHKDISALQTRLESLRSEALTDPLTGVANRRHFDEYLRTAIKGLTKKGQLFSLLLLDIDHFKAFNDQYGHQFGDSVIRFVAQTLVKCVNGSDFVARYGGEEFAIVLPKVEWQDAKAFAEKIRQVIGAQRVVKGSTGEELGRLTISIGVVEAKPGDNVEVLIKAADFCLYEAKRRGRNCTVAEAEHQAARSNTA